MILECDIGNTACKWRVVDAGGVILDRGALIHAEQGFERLAPEAWFDRVRAVSVASPAVAKELTLEIKERYSLNVEWAQTGRFIAGITNSYKDATRLGVDRWAVVVAAYQEVKSPVIIVDAGSAITVDAVDANGFHLGGYIAPGMKLMKNALVRDTGGVRFDSESEHAGIKFGVSTDNAVHAGARAAILGVVLVATQEACRLFPHGYTLFLTGGEAGEIRPYLGGGILWRPDLVLDGLKWLLP